MVYIELLLARGVLREVQISFLPIGHKHSDIDQPFASVAIRLIIQDAIKMQDIISDLRKCCQPKACSNEWLVGRDGRTMTPPTEKRAFRTSARQLDRRNRRESLGQKLCLAFPRTLRNFASPQPFSMFWNSWSSPVIRGGPDTGRQDHDGFLRFPPDVSSEMAGALALAKSMKVAGPEEVVTEMLGLFPELAVENLKALWERVGSLCVLPVPIAQGHAPFRN